MLILLLLLLAPITKISRDRAKMACLVAETDFKVDKLGHVISLNGLMGTGKTLGMVLIANSKIRIMLQKINEKLENTIITFPDVDFYTLNEVIDELVEKNEWENAEKVYKDFFGNMDGVYFDFLNVKSFKKQLIDYIDYYFILNYRINFIISNFYVFSRMTYTPSKLLPEKELEIRNLYKNWNYCLDRCLVILKDEQNVENGNVNSNSKETKLNGEKEFLSLVRQLYEGMLFVIKTKQIYEDEYIGTRRLETARLDMNSCDEIIFDFKLTKKLINKWLSFLKFIFEFKYRFIISSSKREEMKRKAYLGVNWYRKKENFWNGVKSYLTSLGLIVLNVDITLGKKTHENVELFFPLKEGYGTYETHDYSCVRKEMEKMSINSFVEQVENNRFETDMKIKQKSSFLYENREKESKITEVEVNSIW